jgi:hypothetical protein
MWGYENMAHDPLLSKRRNEIFSHHGWAGVGNFRTAGNLYHVSPPRKPGRLAIGWLGTLPGK